MKIVLIHGFNVRDGGTRTVDQLAPTLEARGHTTDKDSADYGYHDLLKVRFNHTDAVNRIAGALDNADVAITHSNGANYVHQAMRKIGRSLKVFHISPALNSKVDIPAVVERMVVMHTRNDRAVKAAKWLLFHPWGAMGSRGYCGYDKRVVNLDFTHLVTGHSDWFSTDNAPYFANRIADLLESK